MKNQEIKCASVPIIKTETYKSCGEWPTPLECFEIRGAEVLEVGEGKILFDSKAATIRTPFIEGVFVGDRFDFLFMADGIEIRKENPKNPHPFTDDFWKQVEKSDIRIINPKGK